MTFEDLVRVNSFLNTTDIKGKAYVEVNNRVLAFRQLYPEGTITTEIISNTDGVCVMKAYVYDGVKLLATGTAYEKESSSFINKTSYIENCETSAVGRALGFLGIGINTSIASAEEVANAIYQQDKVAKKIEVIDAKTAETLGSMLVKKGINVDKLLEQYKVGKTEELTAQQYGDILRRLNNEASK